MDEHEKQTLELPEINAESIETNYKLIMLNRDFIIILIFIIVVLINLVGYLFYKQHNMHDCQAKLYTHITSQKAPSSHEIKSIENPKLYKNLFTECE